MCLPSLLISSKERKKYKQLDEKHDARLQMRERLAAHSLFHDCARGVLIAKIVKHRVYISDVQKKSPSLYLVIESVCLITLMAEREENAKMHNVLLE
jgi:hypothetical protein